MKPNAKKIAAGSTERSAWMAMRLHHAGLFLNDHKVWSMVEEVVCIGKDDAAVDWIQTGKGSGEAVVACYVRMASTLLKLRKRPQFDPDDPDAEGE